MHCLPVCLSACMCVSPFLPVRCLLLAGWIILQEAETENRHRFCASLPPLDHNSECRVHALWVTLPVDCAGPLDAGDSKLCQAAGFAQLASDSHLVRLNKGHAIIKVNRFDGFFGRGTAEFITVNGTAAPGIQYVHSQGEVSWRSLDGQPKSISVPLLDPGSYTLGTFMTSFSIRLTGTSGLGFGQTTEATVTILNTNAATGTVSLPAGDVVVSESAGTLKLNVTRRGGNDCSTSVSYRTEAYPGSGSGHYGADKPFQQGTVEWEDGDGATKYISLPIVNDEIPTPLPGERFYVVLYAGGCAPIGRDRLLVTVTDNDQVGVLSLEPSLQVFSNDGYVDIQVSRVGGSATPITLDYFTSPDSGSTAGKHYVPVTGKLIWKHDDIQTKKVRISIPQGDWWNGLQYSKIFSFRVSYVMGTTILNNILATRVEIVDSQSSPGRIGFEPKFACREGQDAPIGNCYYFSEGQRDTQLVVTRTGGHIGEVSVRFVTTNLTASSFNDFELVSGTLTWSEGDSAPKFIAIPILNDTAGLPLVEYAKVELFDAGNVPVLDPNFAIAYVAVIDRQGFGSIEVRAEQNVFWEGDGLANFTVYRVGGDVGAVACVVETVPFQALAGIDYEHVSQQLTWADGDSSPRSVFVRLIDDESYRFGAFLKSFDLTITKFSNNTFADPRFARVQAAISDDDATPGYASFPEIDYDPFTKILQGSLTNNSWVGVGSVILTVVRKGGLQGNLTVHYRTLNGTGIAGRDFTAVEGDLKWLEGDVSPKKIVIPILDPPIPGVPTFEPTTDFNVMLENQAVYSGPYKQPLLNFIPAITANIVVEESRGKGFFRFENLQYNVSENDGTIRLAVQRVGGRQGAATIQYITLQDGTATTQLADTNSFPTSCNGLSVSGIRAIQTIDGEVREVYCDMSQDPVQGSASMFHWDESTMLYDRQCVSDNGSGDMDNSILWVDLTARIGSGTSGSTNSSDYSSWQAFPRFKAGARLNFYGQTRPSTLGVYARPVPFPMNKRVVWFDWEKRNIRWGVNVVSFDTVGIYDYGGMDAIANNFYFITDGISTVHVGNPSPVWVNGSFSGVNGSWVNGSFQTLNATLLTFDWLHNTVQARQTLPMTLQSSEWCTPDYDAFGNVLWTVKGRVMYKKCTYAGLQVVLGGTIQNPMALTDIFTFSKCPDNIPGCNDWNIAGGNLKSGVDIFAHVDSTSGFLYFGDRGQSGGLFGCSTLKPYGVVRTNIELARRVQNDFMPTAGTLQWLDGDFSTKFLTIHIVKDGVRDNSLYEHFTVQISDSAPSAIIRRFRRARVTIYDNDGSGIVSIAPDYSIVSERGECCGNCLGPERDRIWCSHFYVSRSSGRRGPVCIDYQLKGVSDSTLPLNFSADNDNILSAYTGVHVDVINNTICWAHNDTTTHTLEIRFPLHTTFDLFHKRFAIEVSGTATLNLQAALPSGPTAPVVKARAAQIIEDKDANPGYFSLQTNEISAFGTFGYTTDAGCAQISVDRLDGSDLDIVVDFETEVLLQSENGIKIPFVMQVVDGSHGSNSFCLANNSRTIGACVDSSSALKCMDGFCYILEKHEAKPAIQTTQYVSPPTNAQFIRTSGQVRWKHGEKGSKAITIPILNPSQGSQNVFPLPAFRLVISNVRSSQSGLRAAKHFPPPLPGRNVFGSCSSDICQAQTPGSLIRLCDAHSCRKSETSEVIIVLRTKTAPGTLRIVNSSYFIQEDLQPSSFEFTVKRVFGGKGSVTVNYTCAPSAVANVSVAAWEGMEYVGVNGMLMWEEFDVSDKVISVPIIDDAKYVKGRSKKSFSVSLFAATGGAVIDPEFQTSTVVIVDDDARPGAIVFRNSWQSFSESQATGTIEVARIGGDDLDVYVEFHTGQKSSWAAVFEQTVNASAHPRHLATEIYSCATTLDRNVSASAKTTRRGGGGATLAFDFDLTTFWDGDSEEDHGPKHLIFQFVKCKLKGAVVNAYSLVTAQTGTASGCPTAWTFEGSDDGIKWIVLDEKNTQPCTPNGGVHQIDAANINTYLYYRWTFTRDNEGVTAFKIFEAMLFFAGETSTLQPHICNDKGKCCIFQAGMCDPSGGFTNRLLLQSSYDYEYSRQVLFWKEGDTSTKTISIPILDDCMGCAKSQCNSFDPLQDLPYEEFPIHLGLVSDVEVAQVAGNAGARFPFRKDAEILPFNSTGTVSIVDDDGPGILSVWSTSCGIVSGLQVLPFKTVFGHEVGYDATCAILETARTVEFMVTRTGSARGPASVAYTVEGVTAIPYTDFIPINGTLNWSHDDSSPKVFEVAIVRTPGHVTGHYTRTIRAKLLGADLMHGGWSNGHQVVEGGAQLRTCEKSVTGVCIDPTKAEFVATIVDSDANPGSVKVVLADQPPELQYYVDQANGTVSIFLDRVNGTDLAIFANFETVKINDNEARPCIAGDTSNCEFVVSSGKVYWGDLEDGTKVVSVQLGTSVMRKAFEKFKFRAWGRLNESIAFCGGYDNVNTNRAFAPSLCSKGFASEVTVTVRRSAATGYIGLISQAPWPFVQSDSLGYAVVAVDRLMGARGIVSVDYSLQGYPEGGTAISGIHFLANSGQLTWPDRDNAPKFIQIDIPQGSVPMNTAVDLTVLLRFHSSNTDINFSQRTARVLIKSSNFDFEWKRKAIAESNTIFGELNELTVELQPNVVLGPGTSITISGITGTQTPNNAAISLEGQAARIFSKSADWTQSSGSLKLVVGPGQSVPFATTSTFTFVVRNAHSGQSVNPTIIASGSIVCSRTQSDDVPLICPESVNFPSVSMDGTILQTVTGTFSNLRATSRMCPYDSCPHSNFFGAVNYITTTFASPVTLPEGTKLSLSGLALSESMTANISTTFANISTDVGVGEAKNQSRICSCTAPRCTCEQTFTDVPKDTAINMRIQLQCNALGFGRQNGDAVSVQIGESGKLSDFSGLTSPSSSCNNNCSRLHDLFEPSQKDVSEHVSSTGRLFVSIGSSSNKDFCGNSEYLRAVVTVYWQTVSRTLLKVPAEWNRNSGSLVLYVPPDHRIDADQIVSLTFALRNPNTKSLGSFMYLAAKSASDVVGPTAVSGLVLTSNASPEIEWAATPESNGVKGKTNRLGIGFKFNGPIGGTEKGILVNVSGLVTAGPDNPRILVRPCSFCYFPYPQQQDLSSLVGDPRLGRKGTGSWKKSSGILELWIRGPGPSYLLPGLSLSGMITLANAANPVPSVVGVTFTASVPVADAKMPGPRVLKAARGGALQVLRAPTTATVQSGATLSYADSTAYLVQDAITLKVDFRYDVQYIDKISLILPSLTTCETFVFRKDQTCVQSFVGTARPANTSKISGMQNQAVIFSWNESISTLTISPHGGRALCSNRTFEITIKPSDYGCAEFDCKFKVLPDLVSRELAIASLASDALRITCFEKDCGSYCSRGGECGSGMRCKNQKDFHELADQEICAGEYDCICSDETGDYVAPPSCLNFDTMAEPLCSNAIPVSSKAVEALPGAAWGRESVELDSTDNSTCSHGLTKVMDSNALVTTSFGSSAGDGLVDGVKSKESSISSPQVVVESCNTSAYVQIDLGIPRTISIIRRWMSMFGSDESQTFCNQSASVSMLGTFTGEEVQVFSCSGYEDCGNEYSSNSVTERNITFEPLVARYVRYYSSKSNVNSTVNFLEMEVLGPCSNSNFLDQLSGTKTDNGRAWFGVSSHKDSIFVYGGISNEGFADRVLVSKDAVNWQTAGSSSSFGSFGPRAFFPSVSHGGYLWVFGGRAGTLASAMNDVWKSEDGKAWCRVRESSSVSSTWSVRYNHAAVSYAGKLWIIGGTTYNNISSSATDLDDVWKSDDGITWTSVNNHQRFSARNGHTVVVHGQKMWLYGGSGAVQDVWNTVDGSVWVHVTAAASWPRRGYHSGFSFDGKLWLIGGHNSTAAFSDVWSSTDGVSWQDAELDAYWGKRYGSKAIVFAGRMWMIGGSVNPCNSNGIVRCDATVQHLQCQGAMASCTGNEVWMDAFKPINSKSILITPSSTVLGADNLIKVSAQFDARIETAAFLEISGLENIVADPVFAVSGRNASVVGWQGTYDAAKSIALFTLEEPLPAGSLLSFSFVVRNSLTVQTHSVLRLVARHNIKQFTTCRSSSWSSLIIGAKGLKRTVSNIDNVNMMPYNGGVMFDVHVKNTIMLEGFRMHLPRSGFQKEDFNDTTFVKVYYKEGSHTEELNKLSNWCLLGSATVRLNKNGVNLEWSLDRDFVRVSDLLHADFGWLGPQPTWIRVQNSSSYMSSSFDSFDTVKITAFLSQGSNGLWHSGSVTQSKETCVHFPLCPESWPYDKEQWLSFDLGAKHTLAGFRTSFPAFADAPNYYFDGVQYMDMNSQLWEKAQFKEFEIQYSSGGLSGPWTTAFAAVAQNQATESQTFMFDPRTARYWRLLMRNNYGFPYISLKSIEFYGVFAHCQARYDSLYLELHQTGSILENGVGISSGVHSFSLQSGLGVEFKTGVRRGDILKSDDSLALMVGSTFEAAPKFAWEGTSLNSYTNGTSVRVEPRENISQFLNSDSGFSIVVHFSIDHVNQDGHIFGVGDACSGGLSLEASGSSIKFRQGCAGGAIDQVYTGLSLTKNFSSYCYAVTYHNGMLSSYAEDMSVNQRTRLHSKNQEGSLDRIPDFSKISLGWSSQQNEGLDGSVTRLRLYESVLDQLYLAKACQEQCSHTDPNTGRCYTPISLSTSQVENIPFSSSQTISHGATDIDYMRLPARSCFTKFRLRVLASAGMATGAMNKWCIQELSLFYSAESHSSTTKVDTGNAHFITEHGTCSGTRQNHCSSVSDQPSARPYAFDGQYEDGGRSYCNTFATSSSSPSFISVGFQPDSAGPQAGLSQAECITGYRIQATNSTGDAPTAWYFDGFKGSSWTTIDSQFGITWKGREWKSFNVDIRPFLLITNPYHITYLMKWETDDMGWEKKADDDQTSKYHQQLSAMGGNQANVFQNREDYYLEFLLPNRTRSKLLKWNPNSTNFDQVSVVSESSLSTLPPRMKIAACTSGFLPALTGRALTTTNITKLYELGVMAGTCSYNNTTPQPALPSDVMLPEYASESFTLNNVHFLLVSRYAETRSCSFLFNSDETSPLQSFTTNGAVSWTHFTMDGDDYLVVANFFDGDLQTYNASSTIYKWNGMAFLEWQSIPTFRAGAWKHLETHGQHYLFLSNVATSSSNSFSSNSVIYRYNGFIFEYSGPLAHGGAVGVELFTVNGYTYLGLANMEKLSSFSTSSRMMTKLYKWANSAKWVGGLSFSDTYTPSAMFVERSISDTTDYSEELNTVTLTIKPDRPLPVGTRVTISGLVGSQTFQSKLVLTGDHVFGQVADWDIDLGRLTLVVQEEIPARRMSVVFALLTGIQLQGSILPSISATESVRVPQMSMNGRVLGILRHQAPGLKTVIATESSTVQGALFNNISFTIRSTVHIPRSMVINVTNLKALGTDVDVEITGRDANLITSTVVFYAASGSWSQNTESLHFYLSGNGAGIPAFADFFFSFTLRNKFAAQTPVFPVVRVQFPNGTDYFPAATSSTSILSCSKSPAFVLAELSDSNKVLGASNNITARLQPNAGLMGGTSITIVGLEGSVTGDGNVKVWSNSRLFVDSRGAFAAANRGTLVLKTLPACKAVCPSGMCLDHGIACRFPFMYKEKVYYDCINIDGVAFPVCSTLKDFDSPRGSYNVTTLSTTTNTTQNTTTTKPITTLVDVPIGQIGWANSTGWGYCPSICGPTFPANEVTEFKFQLTNVATPGTASVQDIRFQDNKYGIEISQPMTTKNGILNPREAAQKLFLPAGVTVKTYGKLDYSLSEFTVEAWVKPSRATQTRQSLVQVGNFSLNFTTHSGITVGLPPLTPGGRSSAYTFSKQMVNTSWNHLSVSWSNVTGSMTLYHNGVKSNTIANVHGSFRMNAYLNLGSSVSAIDMELTQVRLWSSASVQSYYNYMIDPASVQTGDGTKLLVYYPFTTASTFTGPTENNPTTKPGSDRSTHKHDLNLTSAQINSIPMTELFLDVYQLS